MTKSILDRFEAKVMVDPNSGCWLWTGAIQSKGYGIMWLEGKTWSLAHRWAA